MATYIPYEAAMDPLGLALGQGLGKGIGAGIQNALLKSDQDAFLDWLKNKRQAEQMGGLAGSMIGGPLGGAAGNALAPDMSGMVPDPKLRTPQMRNLLLEMQMGEMDPLQQAQIGGIQAQAARDRAAAFAALNPPPKEPRPMASPPRRLGPDNNLGLPAGSVVQADAQGDMHILWQPKESAAPWWANEEDPAYGTRTAEMVRNKEVSPDINEMRARRAVDLEGKIQAGLSTPEERTQYDKLMMGASTNIELTERVPKQWYDDLEKNILALDNVKRLKMQMQPGRGGADTVGVRDQIVTFIQKKLGALPADKAVYLSDKAMMYRLIKQTAQEGRMSDQDLNFLANILPQEWQSDEAFRSVLDSLEQQAQAQYNRQYETLIDPVMKAAVPKSYGVYYTGSVGPEISPDIQSMSDEELKRLAGVQ